MYILFGTEVLSIQLSEYFSQLFALSQLLECNLSVAFGVTVTHNHSNIATYALSTESCFGKACCH